MMTQTPVFRAKLLDSNEYAEGYLIPFSDSFLCIIKTLYDADYSYVDFERYRIDPATLEINFPYTLGNQGNKIFASLNKDGADVWINIGVREEIE